MADLKLTLVDCSCYLMSLAVLYAFLKAKVKSSLAFVFVSLFITFFLTLWLYGKSEDCNSNAH